MKTKGDLWARRLRYRVAGHVEYRAYDLRLARDHHTGKTNATPGGLPQNPPLKEWRAQLRSRQSFWVKSAKLRLSTSVSYTYNLDLYDGYMSWHRVVGKIGARWRPLRGLALSASWRSAFRVFEDTG